MSNFQPYQQRVVEEKNALKEKLDKLTVFLGSESFKNLHETDQTLLIMQKRYMTAYLDILNVRIERFNTTA